MKNFSGKLFLWPHFLLKSITFQESFFSDCIFLFNEKLFRKAFPLAAFFSSNQKLFRKAFYSDRIFTKFSPLTAAASKAKVIAATVAVRENAKFETEIDFLLWHEKYKLGRHFQWEGEGIHKKTKCKILCLKLWQKINIKVQRWESGCLREVAIIKGQRKLRRRSLFCFLLLFSLFSLFFFIFFCFLFLFSFFSVFCFL